jgi:hypothetical protein
MKRSPPQGTRRRTSTNTPHHRTIEIAQRQRQRRAWRSFARFSGPCRVCPCRRTLRVSSPVPRAVLRGRAAHLSNPQRLLPRRINLDGTVVDDISGGNGLRSVGDGLLFLGDGRGHQRGLSGHQSGEAGQGTSHKAHDRTAHPSCKATRTKARGREGADCPRRQIASVAVLGASAALFYLGLKQEQEEWATWWLVTRPSIAGKEQT